jgi:phosphotriesterase-related protein
MSVMTVTGPIEPDALGIVLPHEHLFIDLRNQFTEFTDPEKRKLSRQKVAMRNLGRLRLNPYALRDNLLVDDLETAVAEAELFKAAGGRTIVDCTNLGIHRDVSKLRELAIRTGLNVVAGAGYYTQDTHPAGMIYWSAEDIAEQIVHDFAEGIDGTGIRAGVIGEIGTSREIHSDEKKNLVAAALAFQRLRAPIYVHTYPWAKAGIEALDLLLSHDVDPAKVVICHLDIELDVDYMTAILSRGAFLEFDNFGKEFVIEPSERGFAGGIFARDLQRVQMIRRLIDDGYLSQILITNDICLKSMLCHYGGYGYAHIVKNVVPLLLSEGVTEECIGTLLRENPRRLFA